MREAILAADPKRPGSEADWLTQQLLAAAQAAGGGLDDGEVAVEVLCAQLHNCLVQKSDHEGD